MGISHNISENSMAPETLRQIAQRTIPPKCPLCGRFMRRNDSGLRPRKCVLANEEDHA